MFDIEGFPTDDPNGRWITDFSKTNFMVGVTKSAAFVESIDDGDLPSSRWRTESPVQTITMSFLPEIDNQAEEWMTSWRALFNQEYITIGRSMAGVRNVQTARMVSLSEVENDELGTQLTVALRLPGVYWRAESFSTETLAAGEQALTSLAAASAPMPDAKLLVAGGATALTEFSIGDVYSGSGVKWSSVGVSSDFGVFLSSFGVSGAGNGQLNAPIGLALDSTGNIFVADTQNNRVQKFTSAGAYVSQFGTAGAGNGQFSGPRALALDSTGNIFVADTFNNRVQKFDIDGIFNGVTAGKYLLIDIATMRAQIVATNSFDAVGDRIGGLSTVPWAGQKLRLTPKAITDPMVREVRATMAKTGGGTAQLRVKRAFL